MNFTCEQLVDSFTKKYIEDVGYKTSNELFAIFDIIAKEYKDANKCLICETGQYQYNNTHILCDNGFFIIADDFISFTMKANYCPICGKYIGKEI